MIASLSGTEPWRPRILPARHGWARVALVQSRASLLRADDVTVSVVVGADASLELVELGAIVAHSARGGDEARLWIFIEVGEGGRLIWLGQPLIVGAGARVSASLRATLAAQACLLRGDGIVLGRAGEECGTLESRLRIEREGAPLLDEALSTLDRLVVRSPLVAGDSAIIAAVTLAGIRDPASGDGIMQAFGEATLWRQAGPAVETSAAAARIAQRWRDLVVRNPAAQAFGPRPYAPTSARNAVCRDR